MLGRRLKIAKKAKMDKIQTTDCYVPVDGVTVEKAEGIFDLLIPSKKDGSFLFVEKKEGVIVLTEQELEAKIRDAERNAWQAAANAYRLYPDQKHTFANYVRL